MRFNATQCDDTSGVSILISYAFSSFTFRFLHRLGALGHMRWGHHCSLACSAISCQGVAEQGGSASYVCTICNKHVPFCGRCGRCCCYCCCAKRENSQCCKWLAESRRYRGLCSTLCIHHVEHYSGLFNQLRCTDANGINHIAIQRFFHTWIDTYLSLSPLYRSLLRCNDLHGLRFVFTIPCPQNNSHIVGLNTGTYIHRQV